VEKALSGALPRCYNDRVHASLTLIVIVVATAVFFDFTNGFHDTANAMATTIATRALPPRAAAGLASVLNFIGAFISVAVAATIASGIVEQHLVTVPIVFAGLVGAIIWVAAVGTRIANQAGFRAEGHAVEVSRPIDEAIIAYADEIEAPAIVLGARGRSGIGSMLLGDVAHDVVQRSTRPVLLVPSARLSGRRRAELASESARADDGRS
jgi:nucleotide-binding universal stress UspA family protein